VPLLQAYENTAMESFGQDSIFRAASSFISPVASRCDSVGAASDDDAEHTPVNLGADPPDWSLDHSFDVSRG